MTKVMSKVKTARKVAQVVSPVVASSAPVLEDLHGHPILNLEPEKDRYAFRIGLRKLQLILANLETVKKFVESEGTSLE